MSHFAEIDKDGVVQRVIVAEQDFIDSGRLGDPTLWIQTSYNHNIRKQYAGPGFTYDKERDEFISPKPFPSWHLDHDQERHTEWQAPIPYPADDGDTRAGEHNWNEETQNWDQIGLRHANTASGDPL